MTAKIASAAAPSRLGQSMGSEEYSFSGVTVPTSITADFTTSASSSSEPRKLAASVLPKSSTAVEILSCISG